MNNRTWGAPVLILAGGVALTGCGAQGPAETSPTAGGQSAPVTVMASFYPLQYVTERVGGEHVEVQSLTPPGAEPHDLELSPADVAQLEQAGTVVYLSGFQPAVDEAVAQVSPEHVVDAAAQAEPAAQEAGEDHAGEESAQEPSPGADEHAGEAADLHYWLDPQRLGRTAQAVAEELTAADPANAATYEANARTLTDELEVLDEEFTEGLATCEVRTIVVSHEAYGYLAGKYDLEQVGISGLDPEAEPSPARLAEVEQVVEAENVDTIFTETLVNPKVAQTLASDLGVDTAVLDPLEGLAEGSTDYQQVMRANLQALRDALRCQ